MNRKSRGQGLVEYALILVLVAIVAIAILALLGPQIGNVFSQIVYALSTTDAPDQTPIAAKGKGKGPDYRETIEEFMEAASEQDEGIGEARMLLQEGGYEGAEVLAEYSDQFSIIQDAFGDAAYQELIEAMINLAGDLAQVDSDTQIRMILKVVPRVIDAYLVLDVDVPEELRDRATEAADQLGSIEVGLALGKLWTIVDQRNLQIRLIRPVLAESACLGINVLLDTNAEKYREIAQLFQDQIPNCGTGLLADRTLKYQAFRPQ